MNGSQKAGKKYPNQLKHNTNYKKQKYLNIGTIRKDLDYV